MAPANPWKIRAHGDRCSLTGKPFKEGEVFYSCLTGASGDESLQRNDFSESAWQDVRRRQGPFSFWRSVYRPQPDPSRNCDEPLRLQRAETLLHDLMERDDPATEKACYILALSLERNKVLRQVGQEQRGNRRILVYEHLTTGAVLLIAEPGIALHQAAEVEREVRRWIAPNAELEGCRGTGDRSDLPPAPSS